MGDNETLDLGDLIGDDESTGEITQEQDIDESIEESVAEGVADQEDESEDTSIDDLEDVDIEENDDSDDDEISDVDDSLFLDSNVKTQKITSKKSSNSEEIPPGPKPVTVSSFLTTHKDKISNADSIQLKFKNVPTGKYMVFVTKEEEDAQIFKVDLPNTFFVREFEPTDIIIQKSGVIIRGEKYRAYVGKTNTHQF